MGNGMLNMSRGGTVVVNGDLIFNPKKSHEGYLEAGEIKVGGNVEIIQKFYAGSGHRFTIVENGTRHTINMWNKWVQKDQYFGTFNAEPCITKLEIKESFDANTAIWNYSDFRHYHNTGFAFTLSPNASGGTLSISAEINAESSPACCS